MRVLPSGLLALALFTTACPKSNDAADNAVDGGAGGADSAAASAAFAALAARERKLLDYTVEGTRTEAGQTSRFTLAVRAPQSVRLDVVGEGAILTDGKSLAMVDDATKTMRRAPLPDQDPAAVLAQLNAVFGSFAIEGYRAPLFSPKSVTVVEGKDERGAATWVVRQPITDAVLAAEVFTLRQPHADFLGRTTLDKQGQVVASTVVSEEHQDAASQLSFPKVWTRTDGQGALEVKLSRVDINTASFTPGTFSLDPPAGIALQESP